MGRPKGSKNKTKKTATRKVKITKPLRKRKVAVPAKAALADGVSDALVSALSEFATVRRTIVSSVQLVLAMYKAQFIDIWLSYARNEIDHGRNPDAELFCKDKFPTLHPLVGITFDGLMDELKRAGLQEDCSSTLAEIKAVSNQDEVEKLAEEAAEEAVNSLADLL